MNLEQLKEQLLRLVVKDETEDQSVERMFGRMTLGEAESMQEAFADALRYRQLRDGKSRLMVMGGSGDETFEGDELDTALDAEIKGGVIPR